MVDEVLKEADVDEVLNEGVKDEQDEIGVVVKDVDVSDECGENEGVNDEVDDVVLVVDFDDQDEVDVDVATDCIEVEVDAVDDCVKVDVGVDASVAADVHAEDAVVDDVV